MTESNLAALGNYLKKTNARTNRLNKKRNSRAQSKRKKRNNNLKSVTPTNLDDLEIAA